MKRFGYAGDPVCLAACLCYLGNRWGLPLALKGPFLRFYFSDLLLIPAALPCVLWMERRLGLRSADAPPDWREIVFHLFFWSLAAEVVAPHFFSHATGDPADVLAYGVGAVLSGWWWQRA